ncbi:MAG TPA: hypothetical protein VM143_06235 [Acidimicrobiales bacterium]|nr:hypothetical protein [Acidimicrobiales bacterium]
MSPRTIVRASWMGTGVFVVSALAAIASTAARIPAVGVALALFIAGIVNFFWAYAVAVGRSRTHVIGIGGWFFLAGRDTAPANDRRQLLASLGVEVVAAIATAAARPFTSLAFGVLAPVYGLALTGLYGARHGRFSPRSPRK